MSEIKPYIFLSYAHKNYEKALKIKEHLANKYEVWFDEERLHDGYEFDERIANGIYHSSLMICLISEQYFNAQYCNKEITYGFNKHKNILPIYLDHYLIPEGSDIDFYLTGVSALAYGKGLNNDEDFENAFNRLKINPYILALDHYLSDGNIDPMPYLENEKIYHIIKSFYLKCNVTSYFKSDIKQGMFPPFTIHHHEYESENNNQLLLDYIINQHKTILLLGKGGGGKTIALKQIFKSLLNQKHKVLYIPLTLINKDQSIEGYLKENLGISYDLLRNYGQSKSLTPLYLLFDGLNEMKMDFKEGIDEISKMIGWENSQVIMTSRINYADYFEDFDLQLIHFNGLKENKINQYVDIQDMNENMLTLLGNPLMLRLYMNTDQRVLQLNENHRYGSYYPLKTTMNPHNEIEIIYNYLMSQVLRIHHIGNGQKICDTILVIEWLLPRIAYHMDIHQTLSKADFDTILKQARKESEDYIEDRLDQVMDYLNMDDYDYSKRKILETIKKLSLLELNEANEYTFFHQCFKDFFIALYLVKQMELNPTDECFMRCKYDQEILKYCGEINQDGQMINKAMLQYQHQSGNDIQIAMYNYFEILNTACHSDYSKLDLSYLDLRACDLKLRFYSSWKQDEITSCHFEGSYIDLHCFINSGHHYQIKAFACFDDGFYSIDEEGILKKWYLDQNDCCFTFDTQLDTPRQLLYDDGKLYILNAKKLLVYDENSNQIKILKQTNKYFMQMKMIEQQIVISYDIAPLTYYDLQDNLVEYDKWDHPSRLALKMHDDHIRRHQGSFLTKMKANSKDYEMLNMFDYCDEPSKEIAKFRMNGIAVSDNQQYLYVTFGKYLFEFKDFKMIRSKKFSEVINQVICLKDYRLLISTGSTIYLLDQSLKVNKAYKGGGLPKLTRYCINQGKIYTLDINGAIKRLNENLEVERIRSTKSNTKKMVFGTYGIKDAKEILFLLQKNKASLELVGYDFDNNEFIKIEKPYCLYESYDDESISSKQIDIVNDNELYCFDQESSSINTFVNRGGIHIYGCNFKRVQGSLNSIEGKRFIKENGGIYE